MRPACQQRAQCFSGQQWRLESEADPAILQGRGERSGRGRKEGERKQERERERVVFLGLSKGGSAAQTMFCNRHSRLGQTQRALVAHCAFQPQYINNGTKAEKKITLMGEIIYFFTSGCVYRSRDANVLKI